MVVYDVLLTVPKEIWQSNVAVGCVLHLQHWIVNGIGFCMYLSDPINPCLLEHFLLKPLIHQYPHTQN